MRDNNMNTIETYMCDSPVGKIEVCARFAIDDPNIPFIFHDLVKPGYEYTLSAYIKSETASEITIGDRKYNITPSWRYIMCTFTAINTNVPIYFNDGIYYFYHTKVERYGIATDWTPAPEDLEDQYTSFTGDINKWQMRWDKIFQSDDAKEDIYTRYITFQNGDMVLGNSESDIQLNLFNDNILISDKSGIGLAQFKKNSVSLGMDGTASVIDLCKGTGKIRNSNPEESYKRLAIESEDSVEINANRIAKISAESDKCSATIGMNVGEVPWDTTYNDSVENGSIILRSTNKEIGFESSFKLHPGGFQYLDGRGSIESLAGGLHIGMDVRLLGNIVEIAMGMLQVNGNIATNSNVILANDSSLRGVDANNPNVTRALAGINSNNDIVYGYGTYDIGDRYTYLYGGKGIIFHIKNPEAKWNPYICAGMSINVPIGTSGFITTSGKDVYFTVPIGVPIIGNPTVSVSSINGLQVRQNNKYLYGSSATAFAKPSSYTASVVNTKSGIQVIAKMPNTTNVINNEACGIYASIKLTFS